MDNATTAAVAAGLTVYYVIVVAIAVIYVVALWKIFVKAGKPGWAAIVPIYNLYCLFEMTFGNGWLCLLTFVPCVNIVMTVMVYIKLAQAFGKGAGFGIGILFFPFIFLPMLGFGDAQYNGPVNG